MLELQACAVTHPLFSFAAYLPINLSVSVSLCVCVSFQARSWGGQQGRRQGAEAKALVTG